MTTHFPPEPGKTVDNGNFLFSFVTVIMCYLSSLSNVGKVLGLFSSSSLSPSLNRSRIQCRVYLTKLCSRNQLIWIVPFNVVHRPKDCGSGLRLWLEYFVPKIVSYRLNSIRLVFDVYSLIILCSTGCFLVKNVKS